MFVCVLSINNSIVWLYVLYMCVAVYCMYFLQEDERIADGQLGEVEQMMNRNSLNYGEQEDEEDDEDEEEVEEGDGEEEEESDENGLGEGEGKGSNDSLSLRAEMMKVSSLSAEASGCLKIEG